MSSSKDILLTILGWGILSLFCGYMFTTGSFAVTGYHEGYPIGCDIGGSIIAFFIIFVISIKQWKFSGLWAIIFILGMVIATDKRIQLHYESLLNRNIVYYYFHIIKIIVPAIISVSLGAILGLFVGKKGNLYQNSKKDSKKSKMMQIGIGMIVIAILLNLLCYLIELNNPPHDMTIFGLLAASGIMFIFPLGIIFSLIGIIEKFKNKKNNANNKQDMDNNEWN